MRARALRVATAALAASAGAAALLSGSPGEPGPRTASAASRIAAGASPRPACPRIAGARELPSADTVLGRPLDTAPLSADDADRYLLALDAASPRIVTGTTGRSVRGRPLRYALVGDPRDLTSARRAALSRALGAVRAGRGGAGAVERAARGPAVVWIGAGVHANEPSGVIAALALVRRLGAGGSCAARRTLRGTLTVVVPDQNPDGRAAGSRTNAADVDLNRDWFAVSQPETAARLRLLSRYPPTIAIDAHEQAGSGYFAPPYADPVVAGLPSASRRLADGPVSRAIGAALRRRGVAVQNAGYDLLYPGYADSATSLLFGAGGLTLEQGSDLPLAEKARRHEAAMGAALRAVAEDPSVAVRAWAAGFAAATAAGRAGRGATEPRTFGWVLGTARHAADARAVAERLRRQGVRVRSVRRPTRAVVDPLGPRRVASTVLPAGTIVVPAGQPLGRWADVLLGRDAGEAGTASSGSDTWSVPRGAGVEASLLRAPIPGAALRRFVLPRPPVVAAGAPVAFPADSVAGLRAALDALGAGRPVGRTADGSLVTAADAGWLRRAAAAGLAVRRAPSGAAGPTLARPVLATPVDPSPPLVGPPAQLPAMDRPGGWVAGALGAAGLPPTVLAGPGLEVGVPAGTTHLVLGPGPLPGGPPSAAARAAVDAFVRGGGTVVAIGGEGTEAAARLGVSGVRTEPAPTRAAVVVRATSGDDPVGRAIGGPTDVTVAGEPRLTAPPGSTVPLRAADGAVLAPSGGAGAADGLAGRPLVVAEPRGAGRVLTLGFSPAFRRQSAAGEHVLLALLLATP